MSKLSSKIKERHVELLNTIRLDKIFTNTLDNRIVPSEYDIVVLKAYISDIDNSKIYAVLYYNDKLEYINVGPSYVSMDGEYRRYMIPADKFTRFVESDVFKEIIYLLDDSLKVNIIGYSNLEVEDISYNVYILQWILINLSIYNNVLDSHYVENYIKYVIPNLSIDKFKVIYNKLSSRLIKALYNLLSDELGCKLQPLTIYDMSNFGNTDSRIWLELSCNIYATNIILNNISPAFAIFAGYMLVDHSKELYDNPNMIKRFLKAQKIADIVDNIVEINDTNPLLSSNLIDVMDDRKKNIVMSSKSISVVVEHVGKTMNTILDLLSTNEQIKKAFGYITHDVDVYAKYLFDITYALYIINSHMKVTHGDLHLNNCTFHYIEAYPNGPTYMYYEINDTKYYFSTNGVYLTLIDYSRSIVHPKSDLISNTIEPLRKSVMNIYMREFPEFFNSNKNEIEVACLKYPINIWEIITAYDIYNLLNRMIKKVTHWSTSCSELNSKILTRCRTYLIYHMKSLCEGNVITDIEPFNLHVINTVLKDYASPTPLQGVFYDYYTYIKPEDVKYTIKDCDKLPAYVKFNKEKTCDNIEKFNNYHYNGEVEEYSPVELKAIIY